MRNLFTPSALKRMALAGSVLFVVVFGVGTVIKTTVDYLLYGDATAAAESWARYVVENVTDLDEIADGHEPSADSMAFFIRTQQIRYVFGFEIINLYGNVQLTSDGSKISNIHGAVHSDAAALAVTLGKPIISVKEGTPPVRPKYYSEAYLPVIVDGRPQAVVAAYVDLTEQHEHFRNAFLLATLALCVLIGGAVGIPTIALYRRTMEKRQADRHIRFLAHHDALTGLANRTQLVEKLGKDLAALPLRGGGLAVHFLDIDNFKEVNDTLGHDGGDFLLKLVAERLCTVTRTEDMVARLGGDEFVVVQYGVRDQHQAEEFARRLSYAVSTPTKANDQGATATISVGIALAPADGTNPERLLKSADLALYKSKADGRNCIRFFLPEMDAALQSRIALERMLRDAVHHDRFVLHYQPIFEISDRRLIGFEALIRMPGEDGTLIPPLTFIPIAEDLQLIDKIGAWVLREACQTAATWPEPLTVAVNLSPAQFDAGSVTTIVAGALEQAGLAPHRLELEITESLLIGNDEAIMAELKTLKAMGLAIVMDDFGTGYSSLSYLWRFPFDKIKIDRSFLTGLDRSGRNAETVVRTIIALGRELNMRVTIEGVETAKQADFVKEAEGDQAQGYFFGRPVPASEIAATILLDFQRSNKRPAPPVESDGQLRLIK
ncbi:MAG: EAL domain-containing protein [Xanthobacteraceae bacterium]|jgi:diguanylate cyclase (GGDEF)-like protein